MEWISIALLQAAQSEPAPQGLLDFFWGSGVMAKVILGTLVLFSLGSWAVMIGKLVQLARAEEQSKHFLAAFHKSSRFSEVNAVAGKLHTSPLVGIFQAGYAEIDSQIKNAEPEGGSERRSYRITSLPALERTLRRSAGLEMQTFARWIPLLATTAAATPFIGLFGTVWGIMEAFREIGLTGSTSIVTVAPGIAEALVNTAAGLGAAIPALVGYNYFSQRLKQLRGRLEDFVLEFLNLAERNFT